MMTRAKHLLAALLALSAGCDDAAGPGGPVEVETDTDATDDACTVDCETAEELQRDDCAAIARETSCQAQHQAIVGCCQDAFGSLDGLRACDGWRVADDAAREFTALCWEPLTGDVELDDPRYVACLAAFDDCEL